MLVVEPLREVFIAFPFGLTFFPVWVLEVLVPSILREPGT
jgi:hypothetical protein